MTQHHPMLGRPAGGAPRADGLQGAGRLVVDQLAEELLLHRLATSGLDLFERVEVGLVRRAAGVQPARDHAAALAGMYADLTVRAGPTLQLENRDEMVVSWLPHTPDVTPAAARHRRAWRSFRGEGDKLARWPSAAQSISTAGRTSLMRSGGSGIRPPGCGRITRACDPDLLVRGERDVLNARNHAGVEVARSVLPSLCKTCVFLFEPCDDVPSGELAC